MVYALLHKILGEERMKSFKFFGLVLSAVALTACATLFTGPSWLTVETNPSNIKVILNGIQNGTTVTKVTPFKMELDKNSDYSLVVNTPNYRSEDVLIQRKVAGWFWGNIFMGAVIGMAIDYGTDNMWQHNQHLVVINLESLSNAPDSILINVPVRVTYADSSYETVFVPMVFNKLRPASKS
jgi:hypothetical protein